MTGSTLDRLLHGGPRLTVGMITADLLHLGDELTLLERGGAEIVHIDVMDGTFCPMLTVGPPIVKAMRTPLIKDAHLMVEEPLGCIDQFVAAGADMVTIHVESTRQPLRVLQVLGQMANANDPERGIVRGLAINPSTPLETVRPLLDETDYLLVLAVNPGWGGQTFIASTEGRVADARRLIDESGRPIALGIDGGVTRANIDRVAGLGADVIVTGSAVFDGKDPAANLAFMLERVGGTRVPARVGTA